MSRHTIEMLLHDRPIKITMGWDRPLQGFFLDIERLDVDQDSDDTFLYASLDDKDPAIDGGFTRDLEYLKEVLQDFGLREHIPPALFHALESDKALNVGNKIQNWTRFQAKPATPKGNSA